MNMPIKNAMTPPIRPAKMTGIGVTRPRHE
jgi:hypothetical protein